MTDLDGAGQETAARGDESATDSGSRGDDGGSGAGAVVGIVAGVLAACGAAAVVALLARRRGAREGGELEKGLAEQDGEDSATEIPRSPASPLHFAAPEETQAPPPVAGTPASRQRTASFGTAGWVSRAGSGSSVRKSPARVAAPASSVVETGSI